jgi:hypothetical protein
MKGGFIIAAPSKILWRRRSWPHAFRSIVAPKAPITHRREP